MTEIFRNPDCPICNGSRKFSKHALSMEEMMGQKDVGEQPIQEFDLTWPRLLGWRIDLLLHGRRELTLVQGMILGLGLYSGEGGFSSPGYLVYSQPLSWGDSNLFPPWGADLRGILGVYMQRKLIEGVECPINFEKHKLRIGGFPQWEEPSGKNPELLQETLSELPIVHMIAHYTDFGM